MAMEVTEEYENPRRTHRNFATFATYLPNTLVTKTTHTLTENSLSKTDTNTSCGRLPQRIFPLFR